MSLPLPCGDDRALDDVLELAHVPRPGVLAEARGCLGGDRREALPGAGGELTGEGLGEEKDVVPALPKRGHGQREDAEPVEEVLPELPLGHGAAEVAVRRGDDPDVHLARARAAHRLELALLEDTEELPLELERKLAHLVEEDGPPVRQREATVATRGGAGEGAALVAEELALDQRRGDGRAVHLHQRLAPAAAALVDGPGEELLPGPGLPEDEHRRVRRRDLAHLGEHVEKGRAVSEDLPGAPPEVPQLGAEIFGLAGQGGDPPLRLQPLVDVSQDRA